MELYYWNQLCSRNITTFSCPFLAARFGGLIILILVPGDQKKSRTTRLCVKDYGLISLESVKCFVCISDERQTHLRPLFIWRHATCSTTLGRNILLRDIIDGKIRHVDVGDEVWFKRGVNTPKLIPDNAVEKSVVIDLVRLLAGTMFGLAEEASKGAIQVLMTLNAPMRSKSARYLWIRCS